MTLELVSYNGNVADLVKTDDRGKAVIEVDGAQVRLLDQISIYYQNVQPGSVKDNPTLFKGRSCQFYLRSLDDREEDEMNEDADINFVESLRVLPIGRLRYSRSLFPQFEAGGDKEPLCKSFDGFFPANTITEPYAAQCAKWGENKYVPGTYKPVPVCPQAVWVDGNKPECSLIEDWAFFDLDLKIPFVMSLKSTALGAFNKLHKRFAALEVNALRKGTYVEDYFIRISAVNEGTYNQLKFKFEHDPDGKTRQYHPVALYYTEKVLPILDPETLSDDPEKRMTETREGGAIGQEIAEMTAEDKAAAEKQMEEATSFDV